MTTKTLDIFEATTAEEYRRLAERLVKEGFRLEYTIGKIEAERAVQEYKVHGVETRLTTAFSEPELDENENIIVYPLKNELALWVRDFRPQA